MDPKPLHLRDYVSILGARKWAIAAMAAITTAVALLYSFRQTPVYTSSADVLVLPASFVPSETSAGNSTPLNMLREQEIANSAMVTEPASHRLVERHIIPGTMSAAQVEGADTLVFSAVSSDPTAAQATAQTYADAYLNLRRTALVSELEEAREPYESQIDALDAELVALAEDLLTAPEEERGALNARYSIRLSDRAAALAKLNELTVPESVEAGRVLRSAELPAAPSAPNHVRNGLLGIVIGFALGSAIAFFRDHLDDPVRGREELESETGAPVIGFIPSAGWERSLRLGRLTPEAAEAYKALRVKFLHFAKEREARRIVISSSFGNEGKTSVTSHLAMTLALAGKRVVIVSADLRRPQLHTHFPGSEGEGLTEVLTGRRRSSDVLSTTIAENLWILHAGQRSEMLDPSEALGSETMRGVLRDLRDFADFVLIDTPPILTSSDVVALAPLSDGVLFVVDPRLAKRSSVEQARQELQLIDVPMLGVVVNKHDPRHFRAYGFGYQYYTEDGQAGSGARIARTLRAIPTDSEDEDIDESPPDRGTVDLWRPS
jgi:capsular exopolysaccharide synthesis family protein